MSRRHKDPVDDQCSMHNPHSNNYQKNKTKTIYVPYSYETINKPIHAVSNRKKDRNEISDSVTER